MSKLLKKRSMSAVLFSRYLALCRAAVENNNNTIELVNKQHWINRRFNTLDVPTYKVSG